MSVDVYEYPDDLYATKEDGLTSPPMPMPPRKPIAPFRFARHALEHFETDVAVGDFAKRQNDGLVLGFDLGRVALSQLTRAVGGDEHHLEAVRDLLEAVFNGNAGHLD